MYADKITGSMRRSIDETERRREKQQAHNLKHGITPQGINKNVTDIMDGTYIPGAKGKNRRAADKKGKYEAEMSTGDVWKHVAELEEKMFQAAKNLEFEEAAALRDQITRLKSSQA